MTDIWLDTSIVLNWKPTLDSVEARTFLKHARLFKHSVFLSEIVHRELTKQYSLQVTESLRKQKKLQNDLVRLTLPVVTVNKEAIPANLKDYYDNLRIQRCEEESIAIVPLHDELKGELIQRLLQMGIEHKPPFGGKNSPTRAFKDVLIILSILDYARSHEQDRVFLLAADPGFGKEDIHALAGEYGVKLDVFKSVREFTTHLDKSLVKKIRDKKEQQRKRVHSFLLKHKDQIEQFIEENAPRDWFRISAMLRGLTIYDVALNLKEITNVTVSPESPEPGGITTLLLTFDAILELVFGPEKLWVPGEPSWIPWRTWCMALGSPLGDQSRKKCK